MYISQRDTGEQFTPSDDSYPHKRRDFHAKINQLLDMLNDNAKEYCERSELIDDGFAQIYYGQQRTKLVDAFYQLEKIRAALDSVDYL